MFGMSALLARIDRLERIVRSQDRLLRELAERAGLDPTQVTGFPDASSLTAQERQLVESGARVRAIRAFRERTGAGLAEAHRIVTEAAGGR